MKLFFLIVIIIASSFVHANECNHECRKVYKECISLITKQVNTTIQQAIKNRSYTRSLKKQIKRNKKAGIKLCRKNKRTCYISCDGDDNDDWDLSF